MAARTLAELQAVAGEIGRRGGRAEVAPLDVTDPVAVGHVVSAGGPYDILVHSAGMNRPAPLTDARDEDIAAVLELNVTSALFVCREVARGLIAAGRPGSMILVSSQMGHVGGPRRSVYCASKHALEGMVKALAWEFGAQGIRVNTLCPTFIETEMTAPMLADPAFRAWVEARIARGTVGRLEEVMGPVVFLAGDASSLVTGSALMLDGGWTAA